MSDIPKDEAAQLGRILSGKQKPESGDSSKTTDIPLKGVLSDLDQALQQGGDILQKPDFGGMVPLSEGGHGVFEGNAPGVSGEPGGFTSGAQGSGSGGSTQSDNTSDEGSSDYRTNKQEISISNPTPSEVEEHHPGHFSEMLKNKKDKGKDSGRGLF